MPPAASPPPNSHMSYMTSLIATLGGSAAFAAVPLFASLADLQPPWPPAIGSVSTGVVFILSFLVFEWNKGGAKLTRRLWMLLGTAMILLGIALYLFLYSEFVSVRESDQQIYIKGYECTTSSQLVYPGQCPALGNEAIEDTAITDAQLAAFELWTRSSITIVRLLLVSSWITFLFGFVAIAGALTARRTPPRAAKQRQ